jgi:hypothetical protein
MKHTMKYAAALAVLMSAGAHARPNTFATSRAASLAFDRPSATAREVRITEPGAKAIGASVSGAHLSAADRIDAYDAAGRHRYTAAAPTAEHFYLPVVDGDTARYTITGPGVADSDGMKIDAVQVGFAAPKDAAVGDDSEIEASCEANPVTVAQTRAVAYIVVANTTGCTASLIADKSHSGRAFLLTAEHCQIDSENNRPTGIVQPGVQSAANTTVYWQAGSPCDGTLENHATNVAKAVTIGATHRMEGGLADRIGSDLWLMEASSVPDSIHLHYAGITNDPAERNAQPLFAINHGLAKSQQYAEFLEYEQHTDNINDRIADWFTADVARGVINGGASGSGIVNQNGNLIGVLTSSGSNHNPPGPDQEMGADNFVPNWAEADPAHSLSAWLQPGSADATIPGYDGPVPHPVITFTAPTQTEFLLRSLAHIEWTARQAQSCVMTGEDWTNRGHTVPTTGAHDERLDFVKTYDFTLTCTADGESTSLNPSITVKAVDTGGGGGGGGAFGWASLLTLASLAAARRRGGAR